MLWFFSLLRIYVQCFKKLNDGFNYTKVLGNNILKVSQRVRLLINGEKQ